MRRNVVVVGAGPAGLALAAALAGTGVRVTLIERASAATLADPEPDGREIALTHASVALLDRLGAWTRIPEDARHPLLRAAVRDGASPFTLDIASPGDAAPDRFGDGRLGTLVSNHHIRRALHGVVAEQDHATIRAGVGAASVAADARAVTVVLDDGAVVTGDLLVAADARLSRTRDALGITASVRPLGQTMLLVRARHPRPHDGIATEWFDRGHTVAMLPLEPGLSSVVLTVAAEDAAVITAVDADALGARLTAATRGAWGPLAPTGPVHAYPLTMTYADRFRSTRAVLVGDAAVGMHPVTAHGLNFGLAGAARLARVLAHARDVGADEPLARYEAGHRAATRPLYLASLAIVGLYNDDSAGGRVLRRAVLRAGALSPVRRALGAMLMDRR